MKTTRVALALIISSLVAGGPEVRGDDGRLPGLKVSENRRFLVDAGGRPFFWLGDTAWELFHRLDRRDAEKYLDDRASRGFNVIQAVAVAEFDGHRIPNAYGHLPFVDLDPARPAVADGPEDDYWDHVDFVVERANAKGLYVGFLPTWGRYWHDKVDGNRPLFDRVNAEVYGEWLGRRYKDKGLIWILGGDRPVDDEGQREVIRAMARGLRRGDGGSHLMTFHPPGGRGSAEYFHADDWLDFNMRQNGHDAEFIGRYSKTLDDYARSPVKPVLDGEPIYEDHPISFDARRRGHSLAADARRAIYWDVFSGAFGHTYGHHSVWQMWRPDRIPINDPLLPWDEALARPGATQAGHARRLVESRPFLSRVPDDSLIVPDRVPTSVPGSGRYRFVATRDAAGSFAMVYAPAGRAFRVRLDKLSGDRIKAWWFDPRTGEASAIAEFARIGEREFLPPAPGEGLDWVLVLDDASRGFPSPGSKP